MFILDIPPNAFRLPDTKRPGSKGFGLPTRANIHQIHELLTKQLAGISDQAPPAPLSFQPPPPPRGPHVAPPVQNNWKPVNKVRNSPPSSPTRRPMFGAPRQRLNNNNRRRPPPPPSRNRKQFFRQPQRPRKPKSNHQGPSSKPGMVRFTMNKNQYGLNQGSYFIPVDLFQQIMNELIPKLTAEKTKMAPARSPSQSSVQSPLSSDYDFFPREPRFEQSNNGFVDTSSLSQRPFPFSPKDELQQMMKSFQEPETDYRQVAEFFDQQKENMFPFEQKLTPPVVKGHQQQKKHQTYTPAPAVVVQKLTPRLPLPAPAPPVSRKPKMDFLHIPIVQMRERRPPAPPVVQQQKNEQFSPVEERDQWRPMNIGGYSKPLAPVKGRQIPPNMNIYVAEVPKDFKPPSQPKQTYAAPESKFRPSRPTFDAQPVKGNFPTPGMEYITDPVRSYSTSAAPPVVRQEKTVFQEQKPEVVQQQEYIPQLPVRESPPPRIFQEQKPEVVQQQDYRPQLPAREAPPPRVFQEKKQEVRISKGYSTKSTSGPKGTSIYQSPAQQVKKGQVLEDNYSRPLARPYLQPPPPTTKAIGQTEEPEPVYYSTEAPAKQSVKGAIRTPTTTTTTTLVYDDRATYTMPATTLAPLKRVTQGPAKGGPETGEWFSEQDMPKEMAFDEMPEDDQQDEYANGGQQNNQEAEVKSPQYENLRLMSPVYTTSTTTQAPYQPTERTTQRPTYKPTQSTTLKPTARTVMPLKILPLSPANRARLVLSESPSDDRKQVLDTGFDDDVSDTGFDDMSDIRTVEPEQLAPTTTPPAIDNRPSATLKPSSLFRLPITRAGNEESSDSHADRMNLFRFGDRLRSFRTVRKVDQSEWSQAASENKMIPCDTDKMDNQHNYEKYEADQDGGDYVADETNDGQDEPMSEELNDYNDEYDYMTARDYFDRPVENVTLTASQSSDAKMAVNAKAQDISKKVINGEIRIKRFVVLPGRRVRLLKDDATGDMDTTSMSPEVMTAALTTPTSIDLATLVTV
ncbi:hypothetical protein HDE_02163 [Halotydeus destructor]|nr:hypothetical protein HDE_02163 [Halotydeus destructor]